MPQVRKRWPTSGAASEPVQGPQDQHRLHSNTMMLPTFPVFDICCVDAMMVETQACASTELTGKTFLPSQP